MKNQALIIILFLSSLSLFGQEKQANTKIKADFDFKFEKFLPFYPGKSFEALKKTYKDLEELKGLGAQKVYRTVIKDLRYRFPIFIQVHTDGTILSFYSRLPSYFLHDTFHQALINRFGKQNSYLKDYGNAVYIWNNQKGMKITYSGACTITCFPLYINATINDVPEGLGTFNSLMDQLQISKFTGK